MRNALDLLEPSRRCRDLNSPSISIIKGYTFEETFFDRIRALNATLDFGWVSSGEKGTHLKNFFWTLIFQSRQDNSLKKCYYKN